WLHESLPEMAAAYLFHLVQGHAFVDGNKRIGLMTMLVFLGVNSLSLQATSDQLVDLVAGVATRRVSKAEVAVFVQQHTRPRKR
ncbi:MAG TPA: type II toxin-antitoxin system death-on-curing family toxin, partial [Methylomirabilota bacterium]|nr:type II toxin-antitoxin system death-on-curing family toxin [Methylomirabilota bacterium]